MTNRLIHIHIVIVVIIYYLENKKMFVIKVQNGDNVELVARISGHKDVQHPMGIEIVFADLIVEK